MSVDAMPRNIELWRAKSSCKIGRDLLENGVPHGSNFTAVEYALYNLLSAVEDIAAHLDKTGEVE